MIDVKPEILQALESSPALSSLLGVDRFNQKPVYQTVATDPAKFPRVSFFELNNLGQTFADDVEVGSEIHIQIDVWSKGSTSAIAIEVDNTMTSLGFFRYFTTDLFEDDTRIFHKPMRFRTQKEI